MEGLYWGGYFGEGWRKSKGVSGGGGGEVVSFGGRAAGGNEEGGEGGILSWGNAMLVFERVEQKGFRWQIIEAKQQGLSETHSNLSYENKG